MCVCHTCLLLNQITKVSCYIYKFSYTYRKITFDFQSETNSNIHIFVLLFSPSFEVTSIWCFIPLIWFLCNKNISILYEYNMQANISIWVSRYFIKEKLYGFGKSLWCFFFLYCTYFLWTFSWNLETIWIKLVFLLNRTFDER